MTRDNYKRTFNDLKAEISKLLEEKEQEQEKIRKIDSKLRELGDSIRIIGKLSGAEEEEIQAWSQPVFDTQPGLTVAVRWALFLARNREPITATEIRDSLVAEKLLDVDRYENVVASIYTVLGRMVASGEVDQFQRGDRKRAFKMADKSIEHFRSKEAKRFPRLLNEG